MLSVFPDQRMNLSAEALSKNRKIALARQEEIHSLSVVSEEEIIRICLKKLKESYRKTQCCSTNGCKCISTSSLSLLGSLRVPRWTSHPFLPVFYARVFC